MGADGSRITEFPYTVVLVLQLKSISQIWQRHRREREREHAQQMLALRSRLNTMKAQMSKLRREMADLETEIRCTEKNRGKEVAREKELMARFRENLAKVTNHEDRGNRKLMHLSAPCALFTAYKHLDLVMRNN